MMRYDGLKYVEISGGGIREGEFKDQTRLIINKYVMYLFVLMKLI